MNTKFIKVPVYWRLPKKEGVYFIKDSHTGQLGSAFFSSNIGFRDALSSVKADYWLEEVPDLEDEYRDMLDECKLQLEYLNSKFKETGTSNSVISRIEQLLQKSKSK